MVDGRGCSLGYLWLDSGVKNRPPSGAVGQRIAGRGRVELSGKFEDRRRVAEQESCFEVVALPVVRNPVAIVCCFDSFGDAAPSVEAAAGGWWRAEGPPQFAARTQSSGCDVFGSGVVERVGEVVDGGGELRSLIGCGAHGGGPVIDGSLLAFDTLLS